MKTNAKLVGILVLAVSTLAPAGAQSPGASIYKAKCQICHGEAGLADKSTGKAMKVKPITDPSVKNMSEAEMINATRKGTGKMQAYGNSLSDTEIKEVVKYFRTFMK